MGHPVDLVAIFQFALKILRLKTGDGFLATSHQILHHYTVLKVLSNIIIIIIIIIIYNS